MTKIASDAMVIQLAVDMAGDGEVQARLARLNEFIGTINAKAKAAQDSIDLEQMSVEGKYNPDIQRDLEIEKAIKLTDRLNLSAETQLAILAEIEEKHRKSNQLLTQQYSPSNMPGDDMVASFRKNQQEIVTAEEEALAARKKAAKVTEQLENDQLTSRERMFKKLAEINRQLVGGEIDTAGARLRSDAAKREYADDAKRLVDKIRTDQERVNATRKSAEDEKSLWAARLQALNDNLEEEKRLQAANDNDAIVEANQRRARAAIDATTAADNAQNAARQRATAILYSLEDATQRYARVTDELRAHLDAGDITNEQYEMGLANIERRQRAMAGGANHMAYAIGNTVTGLEDFVTVLSITGFGMEGFSAATRAASNNVGQAVRSLGTAASAISAPFVSIGMVLAGAAIPAIYKYVMGAEDAEAATRKWEESLKSLIRTARLMTDEEALQLDRGITERNIAKMKDPDDILDRMKEDVDKIAKLMNEMKGDEAELKARATGIFDTLITTESMADFDKAVDAIAGKLGDSSAEVEDKWRKEMARLKSRFVEDSMLMGSDAATKNLEEGVKRLQEEMQKSFQDAAAGMGPNERVKFLEEMDTGRWDSNKFLALSGFGSDAAILEEIRKVNEDIVAISKEDTLESVKKRKELESYKLELEQLQEQRIKAIEAEAVRAAEIQAQAQHIDQQNMEMELEKLKIQQHKNSLLGDENEAERKLFDLALRRKELMESGIAAPDVLEGLFNSELEAMAAELEKQIAKAEEVIFSAAAMTEPQAYTSANRQIVEAMGGKDDKLQEQVDLLKAIRDHLSGAATLQVEVI